MPEQSRAVRFRPRARLVSILGEHLISDQAVGLIELVKNAYDADATRVEVILKDLADPNTTVIIVRDNGCGMTATDIEEKWLSPAVSHKEQQKAERRRTPRGRLPIGEKGVGRFAVQQLGHYLRLVTKAAGAPEVVLEIDWDAFESSEGFLDDRILRLTERSPQVFTGDRTGTTLIIGRARARWTEALVRKVQRALRRLQSPVRGHEDFEPVFICPDYPAYQNLHISDILERAHYTLRAHVREDGHMDYEYRCSLPGITPRHEQGEDSNLITVARAELPGSRPACGAFDFNLYVWDRTRDLLSRSGVSRQDLDAHSGVSLFRDGLRVFPYGEQGDDWLQLDRERINDPSRRLGNNQVIGYVEVDQIHNPELRDKTNREGLIDNTAFQDLRALVRAAINVFTNLWLQDRPHVENPPRAPRPSPNPVPGIEAIARALEATASDEILIPSGTIGAEPGRPDKYVTGDTAHPVTQREAVHLLVSQLEATAASRDEIAREDEARRDLLLGLAATGMAAERVVHEFGRQVVAAMDAIAQLRQVIRSDGQVAGPLAVLEACLGALRNEFRDLAPYGSLDRSQRTATVDIEDAVNTAIRLNARPIAESQITVSVAGTDFSVRARSASLVQIFDNLINNACWWLGSESGGQFREIRVLMNASDRRVSVEDNGPGVPEHLREHIFLPMVSGRLGGRGLGLFIVSELLEEMNASIVLNSDAGHAGACFTLSFPSATDD